MKKLFSFVLAAVLAWSMLLPANAALTNSSSFTRYGSSAFIADIYTALVTASGNDTTTNADSNVILNQNGDIRDIWAGAKATNQTGSSPTLTVSFLGSFDNATWFAIPTVQGGTPGTTGTMATAALSISTASTTNVSTGLSFSQFGYNNGALLPPYLKVRVAVGGTGTPGWTGVSYAFVKRQARVNQ